MDGVEQESIIFLGDLNYLFSKNTNNALKDFLTQIIIPLASI